ncbi:MAG: hypothetical protein C0501_15585 [Isosphaera sp.]|nr:hypothetical protein [Isosphaera sp.]
MTPTRLLAATAALLFASPVLAAPPVVASARSGNWSDPATWAGGKLPAAGDKVLVRAGHAVTYDVKSDAVIRSVHVSGTLAFAPDTDTVLNAGLVKVQAGDSTDENGFDCELHVSAPKAGEARPALLVGTPDKPVSATAVIRLHYVDGMDKESCPAVVCCGGRMDFHGRPMSRTWVKLGADVAAAGKNNPGATTITLAEPVSGWRPGDRLVVTTGQKTNGVEDFERNRDKSHTEEVAVKAVDGDTVALEAALVHPHPGSGEYRSEVANLSRNVVVESAEPAGVRGHTMYHRHSSGGISYAEFRHLGKEGVLGRYSIHYHLCGDTMRGSSLVGASVHHSKNRWVTVHGTDYLVVRDCVGYKSTGHGFFLEDGTEVYNVLDRNLACQALRGRPLPKQVLPFDRNDGAGFWWANCHNTLTRNVAVECAQYGFRFDAEPHAGCVVGGEAFGDPKRPFDLVLGVRQPGGGRKPVDVRALPFVRFEDNESHSHGFWGLNLGERSGGAGVGPDPGTPFVIRRMKIWNVFGGFGVEVPNVLIDGLTVHRAEYSVRDSVYRAQDYRNVSLNARNQTVTNLDEYLKNGSLNRNRFPGFPAGRADGGARFQPAEVEVAKLTPVDTLPPQTVITHVLRKGDKLVVRGSCADNGTVKAVTVNGVAARAVGANFAEWEAELPAGTTKLTAAATDAAGNAEQTAHEVAVK